MRIREFEAHDLPSIRSCVEELQEYERRLDPRLPPGNEIVDPYVELMFERCKKWNGAVFIAETSGRVVGFICICSKYRSEEPEEGPKEYGYVSDLVVTPSERGKGCGRALLERAETFAKMAGTLWLRVGVLASNESARALYDAAGYRPYLEQLEKQLEVDE